MYFFSNEYTVSLVFRMVNQKPGIKTSYPVAFLLGEKVSFNNSVAMHVRMLLKIIQYLQISLSIKVHNDQLVSGMIKLLNIMCPLILSKYTMLV